MAANYLVTLPGPIALGPASPTPHLAWMVYNPASPNGIAAGNQVPLQCDGAGNLLVNVAVGGGGGGSSNSNIHDSSGNALNSNGSGALNVAVISGGGANNSVGLTGSAAPTSATEAGGIDEGGVLRGLATDISGDLKLGVEVSTANSTVTPLIASASFTGPYESTLGYATIGVAITATGTAIQPLVTIQFSNDGVNSIGSTILTQAPNITTNSYADSFQWPVGGAFFRIVVTEANANEVTLRVQTLKFSTAKVPTTTTNTAQKAVMPNYGVPLSWFSSASSVNHSVSDTFPLPVGGAFTNNNAAPGGLNLGVLPAIAATAYTTNTYTVGRQVLPVTDLHGALNQDLQAVAGVALGATAVVNYGSVPAAVAVPAVNAFITNASSIGGGTLTNNNAAPTNNNAGVLPAVANAAAQTWTEGNQVLLSTDLAGNLRVVTSGGGSNAAAGATGSAPPASASYNGLNVAGTLRGQTGVNPTGSVFAAQTDISSWNGVALGSPSAYGTSPGAVNVQGVNAFVTNTVPVSATTGANTKTNPMFVAVTDGTNVITAAISALGTTPTGTEVQTVQSVSLPFTSGGLTTSSATGLVHTAVAIKATAGQMYGYYLDNTENTAATFFQFFNATAANTNSTGVGTAVPIFSIGVPGGGAANLTFPVGVVFSTAICIAATTAYGNGTSPATAVSYTVWYS